MKFNNLGTTRVVFLIGKYAIKIPRCGIPPSNSFYGKFMDLLEGWKGNRNEYIWSNAKIYDYLCPVRLSLFFSFIIVMDRAKSLTYKEFKNLEKFNFGGYEHKRDSYGKVNNKIIVVDYGN